MTVRDSQTPGSSDANAVNSAGYLAGGSDADTTSGRVLVVTPPAVEFLLKERELTADADGLLALVVDAEVVAGEFAYDLSFAPLVSLPLDVHVERHGDLACAVPAAAVSSLRGATLLLSDAGGLLLKNPNRPRRTGARIPAGLVTDDEVCLAATRVLEEEVNPMLAAHGGEVRLCGHDGHGVLYVEMLGGCQGCSLSRMTLNEGVTEALRAGVSSLREVIDVTDHAAGSRPYFS